MKKFEGVFTALVTPFKNGAIDFGSLERLVQFQVKEGIDGFVVSGTTGESPTLSSKEKKEIFEFIRRQVGSKVPLILGTGSNSTATTIEATKAAESWGADGVLVVAPYYNKPPQRGLVEHFKKVAESTPLPVLLYNVPSRTVVSLSVDTIRTLSQVKNIVGIKEATGDVDFAKKINLECGSKFLITGGDDGTYLKLTEVGARGVISVLSHIIPSEMKIFLSDVLKGDRSAHTRFEAYDELTRLLFIEANPIAVKAALKMMGVIDSDELRLPLVPLGEEFRGPLTKCLKTLELLK